MIARMTGGAYVVRPKLDGPASITGVVKVLTATASKPVYLLDRKTLKVFAQTRSAANGVYVFPSVLVGKEWLVLGLDDAGQYNATVADRVTT